MSKYNGWSNYETWCVNLWLDNDGGDVQYWQEQELSTEDLADALEAAFLESMPDLHGAYADLLSNSLARVDWREIAEGIADDE